MLRRVGTQHVEVEPQRGGQRAQDHDHDHERLHIRVLECFQVFAIGVQQRVHEQEQQRQERSEPHQWIPTENLAAHRRTEWDHLEERRLDGDQEQRQANREGKLQQRTGEVGLCDGQALVTERIDQRCRRPAQAAQDRHDHQRRKGHQHFVEQRLVFQVDVHAARHAEHHARRQVKHARNDRCRGGDQQVGWIQPEARRAPPQQRDLALGEVASEADQPHAERHHRDKLRAVCAEHVRSILQEREDHPVQQEHGCDRRQRKTAAAHAAVRAPI